MKKTIIFVSFMLFAAPVVQAQTADSVIMKYFRIVGGIDKWKNLKSMKMSGNIVMQQNEFPFTLYRKAPNKFKFVLNIMGQQIIPQAFDGETGWMINPYSGGNVPQKVPDDQIKALKDLAEFEDPFIDYRAKGFEASFEGTEEAGGVHCNIIKLVKHKGIPADEMSSFYYFDTDNYLQVMIKQPSTQAMGKPIEIYLSDYREAGDGLLMPYVLDTQIQGQSVQKLNFTAISINEDMSDDFFKFPTDSTSGGK